MSRLKDRRRNNNRLKTRTPIILTHRTKPQKKLYPKTSQKKADSHTPSEQFKYNAKQCPKELLGWSSNTRFATIKNSEPLIKQICIVSCISDILRHKPQRITQVFVSQFQKALNLFLETTFWTKFKIQHFGQSNRILRTIQSLCGPFCGRAICLIFSRVKAHSEGRTSEMA